MRLHTQPLTMHLVTPFQIARGTQHIAENLLVRVQDGDDAGYGEAAPRAFFGETLATAIAACEHYGDLLGDDPYAIDAIGARLAQALPHHGSARAAIDMALYDLVGKRLGVSVFRLLGLDPTQVPATSFTIGLDTPEGMARKAQAAANEPILKIKLGAPDDVAIIRAIRAVSQATLRVDANAGWTVKQAIRMIDALAPYNIEMVEQPIPPGDLDGLRLIRAHSPIPIFADESCVTAADIPQLVGAVDGINIKLVKCGGISQALKLVHVARAHGLRIMLGCMIESSLGITAAAHLAPLVDMLDLDGALLVRDDPFIGVRIVDGQMTLPHAPGLGVMPRDTTPRLEGVTIMALPASGSEPSAGSGSATSASNGAHQDGVLAGGKHPTRTDALQLMYAHVKQDSLRKHMLSVEAAMRAYARKFGEDEEIFGMAGLLHDSDYEEYPDLREHTQYSTAWLRELGYDPRIIHAILAHNDINALPREDTMSKALVACDEVTGLITAAVLVRPDKSIHGLEASSIRKKMKDKAFARSINRDDIIKGAEALGVDLDEHITFVIQSMRAIADELGLAGIAQVG